YEDSGNARKYTSDAISSVEPNRPSGISCASASFSAGSKLLIISVSTTPGATAFTVTPDGASSFASAFVKALIPPLVVEYSTSQAAPVMPHTEETLIKRPYFCLIICGINNCVQKNIPFRLIFIT